MSRYIDADKLIEDIYQFHLSDGKFQHWVEVQQTVDAEPIRHGRWKYEYSLGMNYCTECGWGMVKGERRHYNYCPNCGAKMEGSDRE